MTPAPACESVHVHLNFQLKFKHDVTSLRADADHTTLHGRSTDCAWRKSGRSGRKMGRWATVGLGLPRRLGVSKNTHWRNRHCGEIAICEKKI